jgi:glycogen debranching enzyme
MIQINQEVCNKLDAALNREWLETNGIGGFSSFTITGANTRRYHGLLTAATKPPVERMVLLSKLQETLVIEDRRFDLSTNQYQGAIHPRGFELLASFRLDPFPVFTFTVEGVVLEKSVFMPQGSNSVVVEYRVLSIEYAEEAESSLRSSSSDCFSRLSQPDSRERRAGSDTATRVVNDQPPALRWSSTTLSCAQRIGSCPQSRLV